MPPDHGTSGGTLLQIDPYHYPNVIGDGWRPEHPQEFLRGHHEHRSARREHYRLQAQAAVAVTPGQLRLAVYLDQDPNYFKTHVIGSGPFKFKSHTRGSTLEGAGFMNLALLRRQRSTALPAPA